MDFLYDSLPLACIDDAAYRNVRAILCESRSATCARCSAAADLLDALGAGADRVWLAKAQIATCAQRACNVVSADAADACGIARGLNADFEMIDAIHDALADGADVPVSRARLVHALTPASLAPGAADLGPCEVTAEMVHDVAQMLQTHPGVRALLSVSRFFEDIGTHDMHTGRRRAKVAAAVRRALLDSVIAKPVCDRATASALARALRADVPGAANTAGVIALQRLCVSVAALPHIDAPAHGADALVTAFFDAHSTDTVVVPPRAAWMDDTVDVAQHRWRSSRAFRDALSHIGLRATRIIEGYTHIPVQVFHNFFFVLHLCADIPVCERVRAPGEPRPCVRREAAACLRAWVLEATGNTAGERAWAVFVCLVHALAETTDTDALRRPFYADELADMRRAEHRILCDAIKAAHTY